MTDEQRVLALLSPAQQAVFHNLEVSPIEGITPSVMFDGLSSLLQPVRLYHQEYHEFGTCQFTDKLREVANAQIHRRAQRASGILFCPIFLNALKTRGMTAEEFLARFPERNSHRTNTPRMIDGLYYVDDSEKSYNLHFGTTDNLTWVRATDSLEPGLNGIHWFRCELRAANLNFPAIMLEAIQNTDYTGRPITDLVDHPALAGLIVNSAKLTIQNNGSQTLYVTPTKESYMAAHRAIPVIHSPNPETL